MSPGERDSGDQSSYWSPLSIACREIAGCGGSPMVSSYAAAPSSSSGPPSVAATWETIQLGTAGVARAWRQPPPGAPVGLDYRVGNFRHTICPMRLRPLLLAEIPFAYHLFGKSRSGYPRFEYTWMPDAVGVANPPPETHRS